jgi:ATP-dependent Clp protease, protease subunit
MSTPQAQLLAARIVFLGAEIDDVIANTLMAQLLHLEGADADADIALYINSPGGSVTSALAILDTIDFIKPAVSTFCIGQAASAAAVLLAAGAPGKRYALPHSRVVLHQPHGAAQGQSTDIELAASTGQPLARIQADTDRDLILSASEAQSYGLIDEVVTNRQT